MLAALWALLVTAGTFVGWAWALSWAIRTDRQEAAVRRFLDEMEHEFPSEDDRHLIEPPG
jgi:hypothetical protein